MVVEKSISWLEQRKLLNVILILAYFALILGMHNPLVNVSIWIMQSLSLPTYDLLVGGFVVLVVLFCLWIFWKNYLRKRDNFALQMVLGTGTLAFLVLHSQVLAVMNIEAIHFLQFMFLSWLVYPLFRRVLPTLLLTLLFAFGDELFQYQFLYPERESYLDLNDVLMDLYGMGMGMLFLLNAGMKSRKSVGFWRSPMFWIWGGVVLGLGLGFAGGYLALFAGDSEGAIFLFNEGMRGGDFWQEFLHTGIFFHVLRPIEGFLIILMVLGFYLVVDIGALSDEV